MTNERGESKSRRFYSTLYIKVGVCEDGKAVLNIFFIFFKYLKAHCFLIFHYHNFKHLGLKDTRKLKTAI